MCARIPLALLSTSLLLAALCSPASAQIHGVPSSVTSFGFGGSNNPAPGIPASVTSLGPNGWGDDCCFGPFVSPARWPHFDRRREHDREFPVGLVMPVYVPYPVPYTGNEGDDENVDLEYNDSHRVPTRYERAAWDREAPALRQRSEAPPAHKEAAPPASSEPPAPVAPQPPTVLIYKDGHKSEVQNYAIVGDTLFDFGENRTHKILLADLDLTATRKINDERGVDFQVPKKAQSK